MSVLRVHVHKGKLIEDYKEGMQKILPLPINYGSDIANEHEFFAYLTTLGGGLVNGDNYSQSFTLSDSKASIRSQSNQKIYKGHSRLTSKFFLDKDSILVFHNDANIFYENSNFISQSIIKAHSKAKFFYLDGGFINYAKGQFATHMSLRLYLDQRLYLNDVFVYDYSYDDLMCFFKHPYFYSILIKDELSINKLHTKSLKAHVSQLSDLSLIRIMADSNDEAMEYIEDLKRKFLSQNAMSLISAS